MTDKTYWRSKGQTDEVNPYLEFRLDAQLPGEQVVCSTTAHFKANRSVLDTHRCASSTCVGALWMNVPNSICPQEIHHSFDHQRSLGRNRIQSSTNNWCLCNTYNMSTCICARVTSHAIQAHQASENNICVRPNKCGVLTRGIEKGFILSCASHSAATPKAIALVGTNNLFSCACVRSQVCVVFWRDCVLEQAIQGHGMATYTWCAHRFSVHNNDPTFLACILSFFYVYFSKPTWCFVTH
jgi:hypothetical protein